MNDQRISGPVAVDPWLKTGHRFRTVALLSLITFGLFAFYDSRAFYGRYLNRCEIAPTHPECSYLPVPKTKPVPNLGINIDNQTGRWALQLEATDEHTANDNSAHLRNLGANPRLIKMPRAKGTLYYIQLGRFKTQKDAFSANAQLRAKGITLNFVVAEYRAASQ